MQRRFTDAGVFIAFEGGEGAGKSTQAARLVQWLSAEGFEALLTREPGGTDLGQQLRSIVLEHQTGALSPRAEALIYAADKAEHVDSVLEPALADGKVIVSDRYVDSALAYQGAGRALQIEELELVNTWATSGLRPHLTVVLDVDPETGLARFDGADRIEAEPLDFHQRVREGFLRLAAEDPEHYLVLDAATDPDQLHAAIIAKLEPILRHVKSSAVGSTGG